MKIFYAVLLSLLVLSCGKGNEGDTNNRGNRGGWGGRGGASSGPRATAVETAPVKISSIYDQVFSYGNVLPDETVNVTPQLSELVTKINVDIGDSVSKGEILAELRTAALMDQIRRDQSQIKQTRIALNRDSLTFERQKKLFAQKLGSEAELQNAESAYQQSLFQLESAQASYASSVDNLSRTKITSPVNGVIVARNISVGNLAGTGTPAFEIAMEGALEVFVYLPLQDWRKIKVNQEVSFRINERDPVIAKGFVARVNPRLNPQTGLGEVQLTVTEGNELLSQGMLIQSVIQAGVKNRARVIPRSGLVENVQTVLEPESNTIKIERSYSVFVVLGDTLAVRRTVETGWVQGDMIELTSGVFPNEKIVVTGQGGLEDSSKVRIPGQNAPEMGRRFARPGSENGDSTKVGRSGNRGQGGWEGRGTQRPDSSAAQPDSARRGRNAARSEQGRS